MSKDKLIVLIDGHSLAYRSYFALERTGMRNSGNIPTWGVYGFFKAFFDLIARTKPDAIAISFDVSKKTFRNNMYPEYKANRPPMPDAMREQMGQIRRGIEALNIPIFEQEGFEADDVIGTICKKMVDQGNRVMILTGDQDSFQLIDNDKVTVLLPQKGELTEFDREKVYQKFGVYPEQLVDYKGLRGDSSDNIPGVKGVGEKTAVELLKQFNNIEEIYNNLDKISKKALKTKLEEGKDIAILSKDLAKICRDVEMDIDFECCSLEIPDLDSFIEFLKEMEFRNFLKQLPTLFKNFVNYDQVDIKVDGEQISIQFNGVKPELKSDSSSNTRTPEVKVNPQTVKTIQEAFQADETGQVKFDFALQKEAKNPVSNAITVDTEDKFKKLIENLQKHKLFAIDLETDSLNALEAKIVGIAISWQKLDTIKIVNDKLKTTGNDFECCAAYIPVGHNEGIQLEINTVLENLKEIFESTRYAKILHNAKYDIHVLKNYNIHLKNVIYDTMLASYIEDPAQRHGLKELAMSKFHFVMSEYTDIAGKGKKQVKLSDIDIETVAGYARLDSSITLKLAHYYASILSEEQEKLLYKMEIPLIEVLVDMERAGIGLDINYLKDLSKEIDNLLKKKEDEIYKEANYPEKFNINSTKQLGNILFDHMGIPAGSKTKTKTGYSTSAQVLEKLAKKYQIAQLILDYRHLAKLKSTYVDALPKLINKKTGRIHTTFNQTVTTTGRLSSSDPNLQNIPIRTELGNRIRKAFVPASKDDLLLAADYSQIELRFLADISQEKQLIKAFKDNKDIHTDTACKIFNIKPENVDKEKRRIAKAVNFGIVYGQTPYGLSETIDITPKEAKAFIDKYFETYPDVRKYMDHAIEEAHKTGYAVTKFGRKRYLANELKSRIKQIREFAERAAINSPLQGSAADLIKLAMLKLHTQLKESGLRARILLQVHDELILEVPQSELDRVVSIVKDSMEKAAELSVPLVVDIAKGISWMDAK